MSDISSTFSIEGEFSIYRAAHLHPQLQHWVTSAPTGTTLQLDLSEVSEFDSAGLQLLLSAALTAQAQQCQLRIAAASDAVVQILQLTQYAHWLAAQPHP